MRLFFLVIAMVAATLVVLSSCAVEEADPVPAPLAVKISALDSSCSATGPAGAVSRYRVKVVDRGGTKMEVVADEEFSAESSSLVLEGIKESQDLELTLLGLGSGEQPIRFARARNIVVTKNETTYVDAELGRYADYACPKERPSGAPNVMFPSVTQLPDGRILIAGGFTQVKEEAGRFEVTGASRVAYWYDPIRGKLNQAGNLMNAGRGAHAAAYIPLAERKLVLLVGGADRLYMDKKTDCFPWYFLKEKAGDVGLTYELYDADANKFLGWDDVSWPDEAGHQMVQQARRVFPAVAVNNDKTVLVTGGGQWTSCQTLQENDADYRVAELYRPNTDLYPGGFMDSYGALTMAAMRAGHTATFLETKDKLNYTLFWGGSVDGPEAEVYMESSGQMDGNFGVFSEVVWLDKSSYKSKRPFFHSVTPLSNRTFLLVGGANYAQGKLKPPSASDAFLVQVTSDLKVGVSPVEGMGVGRYMHAAATYDNDHVLVLGGFTSGVDSHDDPVFSHAATDDLRLFDMAGGKLMASELDKKPLPRAGLGAAALIDDCMLLMGGVDQVNAGLAFQGKEISLVAEVLCPSFVCPQGLWDTVCYPEE